jgi:hypothetical protein
MQREKNDAKSYHDCSASLLPLRVPNIFAVKTALKVFGIAAELTNHSFPKNR